jgi:RNA polymerase sigma factor for flagellar operon FliA
VAVLDVGADVDSLRVPVRSSALAELWSDYLADPTRPSRDRLVIHYAPLVRAVAHRVAAGLPSYVDNADLAQSGIFGLIDAVERFEPGRCARFERYAAQRIRGAILDELRTQDWVPRHRPGAGAGTRTRPRAVGEQAVAGRHRPGAGRRARGAGPRPRWPRPAGAGGQCRSVGGQRTRQRAAGRRPALDPMVVVQARETLRQLNAAVSQLGERDRRVVELYYLENRTLAEIGRMLGITESRVCQLHSRLVGRLRGRLEELAVG